MTTRTTGAGLHLIKRYEALRLKWYRCPAGYWTIGWGTREGLMNGSPSRQSSPNGIDASAADYLLRRSLKEIFEPAIERLVPGPLTSWQFNALASFVYNVGPGQFEGSTLLDCLIRRDYEAAGEQFSEWIWAGGKIWKGLIKRRESERRMFEGELIGALEVQPERLPPMDIASAEIELPRLEKLRGHIPTAHEVTSA